MGEFSGSDGLGNSDAIELVGKIVVIAIVLLLFVVVFVFCIHIYARWVLSRRRETDGTGTATRRRQEATVPPARRGLDPSVLKTLPVTAFSRREHTGDGLECAVCLSEVADGEKVRALPECKHGFHVDCIDAWFKSHSTCPICRNLVSDLIQTKPGTAVNGGDVADSGGAANFPTNVLFWGDEVRVSTTTAANTTASADDSHGQPSSSSSSPSPPLMTVVIDIPGRIEEGSDREMKSPVLTRLRSLKRLFSGNSRRVLSSSPRNLDVEQGGKDKEDC